MSPSPPNRPAAPYRGAVEKVGETGVSGWCLAAMQPFERLELELRCEGLPLGRLRTQSERTGLSRQYGGPVPAGFVFHWSELESSRLDALIEALERAQQDALHQGLGAAPPALEVRPLGADDGLPPPTLSCTRAELLQTLHRLRAAPRRSAIAERAALLANAPPLREPTHASNAASAEAFAFYLPQFHAIPENDDWWGPGFTEWTNVAAAQPLFPGHEQPRLPSELGFYDLRTPGVMEAQIELAQAYGLAGFCFHHYWFGGRRLLEAPLRRFLEIEHSLQFCLCWANEPWSRRWDGTERAVLMGQPHRYDTDVAFLLDVLPLLRDRRYRCVDGRPLIVVYRVALMSEPARVFERWRALAVEHGLPGLYLCMAETFGAVDPFAYGCDSALEFPPLAFVKGRPLKPEGLAEGFQGHLFDYAELVTTALAEPEPDYPRFPGVALAWDNTARRGAQAHVFGGYAPGLFERWLHDACRRAERRFPAGQQLVFINAWNEWAEGSYLEPDRRWGRRSLEALRDVLLRRESPDTALALLRSQLVGDAVALRALERLDEARRGAERALAQALRPSRLRAPDIATWLATAPPGLEQCCEAGHAQLERSAGVAAPRLIVVDERQWLWLEGWHWLEGMDQEEFSPLYLCCATAERLPQRYYAAVSRRLPREDLLAASGAPRGAALWSGFRCALPMQGLPPGRYHCALVVPGWRFEDGAARECRLPQAIEVRAT